MQEASRDHIAADATKMQKDIALVDAALACVRDDGSVDLDRLLLVEYEHNLGLLQRVVAKAGRRLDKRKQDPSYEYDPDIRQMDVSFLSRTESTGTRATTVTIARHDDALWSIRPDSRRMTDAEMAGWMAICARHCAFSFLYDAFVKECERQQPQRRGYIDYEGMPCFKHMWLASVARGLAGRTDAWRDGEVTRTRSLCIALAAILDARIEGGPLAIVDTPAGDRLDQAVAPSPAIIQEDDQEAMASMRGALEQVQYVKQQLGFTFSLEQAEYRIPNTEDAADHTRTLLCTVYRTTDRFSATEPYFLASVDPGEAAATDGPSPGLAKLKTTTPTLTEMTDEVAEDKMLADAALGCVRWDESVDVGRLLLLEHEHNLGLLGRAVARAGARLDEYDPRRSSEFVTHVRAVDLDLFFSLASVTSERKVVFVHRHDSASWSIEDDDRRMTDAQVASWMALCARHCSFMLEYNVQAAVAEGENDRRPDCCNGVEFEVYERMWLASVVRGLAARSGAWSGIEIMRTRNLCLALLAIAAAREKDGPLAMVNFPRGVTVDQGVVPVPLASEEGDDALSPSIGEALAQAEYVEQQLGFTFCAGYTGYRHLNTIDAADHTQQVLSAVYAATERMYATEASYVGLIAPAEYEAVAAEAPLGAALLH
ncbi:hypothetical protein psal_cds_1164 [Pandoravirus salinus]|uniref:Uncharacterized protein n=1 Tax=Pandoravirus salinus TaxID=1349410 RepID=S4W413_9VIRU|nr:hypothetical protein psal_cds_1164 [Pandoravirus salinus]AGO85437.1 hypothetical protein psal_cds_1164 [Pandoravirus salinus]